MHGKGAVDGVGGAAKRTVWRAIKTRTLTVNGAKDFCNALNGSPNLEAFHIDDFCKQPWVLDFCKNVIDDSPEVNCK
jgi:hypothetical protein